MVLSLVGVKAASDAEKLLAAEQAFIQQMKNLSKKTDRTTCVACYARGFTHCIKENLIDSECSP